MVFFARSRQGYEGYLALGTRAPLWVTDGVLSLEELRALRATGLSVTNFTRPIPAGDPAALAEAVATIREHHPGEPVWVEAQDL